MDRADPLLRRAAGIVAGCDRCGSCTTVCPLYAQKDLEASCARGKNSLALALALARGQLEPSPDLLERMNFCLLCRACVANCPTKVATDEAMIHVRQHLVDRLGGPGAKYRLLGGMMKSRRLVRLSAAVLELLRRLGAARLVPWGLVPEEITRRQFLGAFAGPAALGGPVPAPVATLAAGSRVAYFNGCGMRLLFPDAAASTRRLLAETAPTRPREVDNLCCGLIHLAHGLRADFLAMARENIRLFRDVDVIVSDCASCSGTLKHLAGFFQDDPEWREPAAAFSRKVMDLTEYLVAAGYRPRRREGLAVTFHEPCHLGRGQNLRRQPRDLLRAAADYVEMEGADVCCGASGSFHLDYPEVSAGLLAAKRARIEKTGAEVVVSECPACLTQLHKAARASGGAFRVLHLSQIL
jgi:glycolate oxidase iron-sulfur subunit